MDLSRIDKNRITVAVVATVAVAVVGFMASGRSADTAKTDTSVATTTTLDLGLATDNTADAPANLDGPISADPNGQGQIAYPADNDGQMARGAASFKRFPTSARTGCVTSLAPLGAEITVRNLNNGMKTKCFNVNIILNSSGAFDITLDASVFEAIAELVDAPIPVELTW
jgi:hypothetical protein